MLLATRIFQKSIQVNPLALPVGLLKKVIEQTVIAVSKHGK